MVERVAGQPLTAGVLARPGGWVAAPGVLLLGGSALVAYLLARFPYDGLYGQDAYAYYGQARALWRDLLGQPPLPGQLYSSDGLYHWPIGYHLHLMLGFLLGGISPTGGRALTLLLTVLTPVLVALLTGILWPGAPVRARTVAGLLAGGALLLNGTYMRMGLSLMSDVPALFWSILAVLCCLRAWPPDPAQESAPPRRAVAWAAAAGFTLGLAVLIRYGAGLLLAPLLLYLLVRHLTTGRPIGASSPATSHQPPFTILVAALGFGAALLPQALYLLTHHADLGAGGWLDGWSLGHFFARTVSSADGTATFAQPMIVFYLLAPLGDAAEGFLPAFTLPALLLGAGVLLRARRPPVVALLGSWCLVPALFFSGTAYQAQRFVSAYLPALTILLGIGGATALEWAIRALHQQATSRRLPAGAAGALILLGLGLGAWQGAHAVRDWVAAHAGWKADEQQVLTLARRAAGSPASATPPHVVAFGMTAALDYYTGWPVRDLYNVDEPALAGFLAAPGPRLIVLPESTLATQWAHTPLAARWDWLRAHYTLIPQGQAVGYTVYSVSDER